MNFFHVNKIHLLKKKKKKMNNINCVTTNKEKSSRSKSRGESAAASDKQKQSKTKGCFQKSYNMICYIFEVSEQICFWLLTLASNSFSGVSLRLKLSRGPFCNGVRGGLFLGLLGFTILLFGISAS